MSKAEICCVECGNHDYSQMTIIIGVPWVIECDVCGHPNDNI